MENWNGTRKATEFGAACPQLPAGWLQTPAWNEDCLFLNIWTTRFDANAKRPVIVYFHGGGNAIISTLWVAGEPLSRAIIFDPRLPLGISGNGSEGKRAANTISQVREVSLSQSVVEVVVSK